MQSGCEVRRTPPKKKANLRKIEKKKKEKLTKSRKLTKIDIILFTNGSKVMSFRGVNPLTPNVVKVRTSPKLILHTPLLIYTQDRKNFRGSYI